ncbi:CBO0543 family protein [Bacillus salacetis]|uniref:CBO0543 family protein n=1 Tax=Bacillus salacetis TaxID=2315464 RepID=UPI003BA3D5C7
MEDQLYTLEAKGWYIYEFLTAEWWLLLCFFIFPWIIWVVLKKRKWMVESILFGLMIMLITVLLDTVGLQFGVWEYPIVFVPVIPRAFPFDLSMVPVPYMLMFQYFRTWKSFSTALIVMAAAYAFIGEPFCEWLKLVQYLKWNYFYSFVYYIAAGLCIRFFIINIMTDKKMGV